MSQMKSGIDMVMESLCRCLGTTQADGSNGCDIINPLSAQPKGASMDGPQGPANVNENKGTNNSNGMEDANGMPSGSCTPSRTPLNDARRKAQRAAKLELKNKEWDDLFDGGADSPNSKKNRNSRTDSNSPTMKNKGQNNTSAMAQSDLEHAAVMAKARRQALAQNTSRGRQGRVAATRQNHTSNMDNNSTSPSQLLSSSTSSSSTNRLLEKSRCKTNKRKADIFRPRSADTAKKSNHGVGYEYGPGAACGGVTGPPNPISAFASRLLMGNTNKSSVRANNNEVGGGVASSFNTGAILCFANPIHDDSEDETDPQKINSSSSRFKLKHMDGLSLDEDNEEDCETVTSTLYFDAKYEHVVENQPPLPLYPEFTVNVTETMDDEIRKILERGTHKSLPMIHCGSHSSSQYQIDSPSPIEMGVTVGNDASHSPSNHHNRRPDRSRYPGSNTSHHRNYTHSNSVMDGTMSGTFSSDASSFESNVFEDSTPTTRGRQMNKNDANSNEEGALQNNTSSRCDNGALISPNTSMSSTPSHQHQSNNRTSQNNSNNNNLEVISDWVDPPSLKLMSKSSLSTAALTPVCSSQSHVSQSPKDSLSMNKDNEVRTVSPPSQRLQF